MIEPPTPGISVTVVEYPNGFLLRIEHDVASITLDRDEAFDLYEKMCTKLGDAGKDL